MKTLALLFGFLAVPLFAGCGDRQTNSTSVPGPTTLIYVPASYQYVNKQTLNGLVVLLEQGDTGDDDQVVRWLPIESLKYWVSSREFESESEIKENPKGHVLMRAGLIASGYGEDIFILVKNDPTLAIRSEQFETEVVLNPLGLNQLELHFHDDTLAPIVESAAASQDNLIFVRNERILFGGYLADSKTIWVDMLLSDEERMSAELTLTSFE